MTPEEMAACAAGGRYWFMRADGTFYGSDNDTPAGDTRLGDFPPSWVEQWDDWQHAVQVMAAEGLFARLDQYRNEEN
jgi:hypothetical protein